jgi:glucosyl-3-phosphoglycerate synthase
MEKLPVKTTVIWPGSKNLSGLCKSIKATIDVGPPGKGRDVWIALGYLLNDKHLHALGFHDADIENYTREIPLRLLMPLTHPEMNFSFCKGFYARISNSEMHGRATRLLVAPLITLLEENGRTHAVNVISAMRYALAGEFAMTTELARKLPVPRDWGLEVGILSAVADKTPVESICQADLCDNYQHKHQTLSRDDASKGLNRMAVEITETLLRDVRAASQVSDLPERYARKALDMIPMYRADALANGLTYREDKEIEAINTFTDAVRVASERFGAAQGARYGLAPLPSWNEVEKMVPGLAARFREAVVKDNS